MTVKREWLLSVDHKIDAMPWRRYKWTLERRVYILDEQGAVRPDFDETELMSSGHSWSHDRAWKKVKAERDRREGYRLWAQRMLASFSDEWKL